MGAKSVTASRRVRHRSWKWCLWAVTKHHDYCTTSTWESIHTVDSQEPGDHARTRITSCCYLNIACTKIWWWSAAAAGPANLWSHWEVAVTHQPARDQEGNTQLCCQKRCGGSTDEPRWGKVKATAAMVQQLTLMSDWCSPFEDSEKWPLSVDLSHARQTAAQEHLI